MILRRFIVLRDVYGVTHPEQFISFEDQVKLDHTSFIDGYIPSTKVLIEQKGSHVKLGRTAVQSDGEKLTPYGRRSATTIISHTIKKQSSSLFVISMKF